MVCYFLAEVSNQMLELYEQNRVPPSSDLEGSAASGITHRAPPKATTSNEEHVTTNSHSGAGSTRPGTSKPSSSRPASEMSHADNHGGPPRATESRSSDHGNTEAKNGLDHKADGEFRDNHPEELPHHEKERVDDQGDEHQHNSIGKNEVKEHHVRNLEGKQGTLGRSPQEAIKKIDRDKVKAALEKRRKSIGDVARKTDVMDDDDLIERELEEGIELGSAGSEKSKRDRNHHQKKPDLNNVEEGELSMLDDVAYQSPKSNAGRKRKAAGTPPEAKQRHDYAPSHNHIV